MEANLKKAGVKVATYKQQKPDQPDAVFPNNWFSTHKNDMIPFGVFITYPMKAPSRQAEYNPQIVKEIGSSYRKHIKIPAMGKDESLEGTGSLVFDHKYKRLYVCISERACAKTLQNYLKVLNEQC